MPRRSSGQKKVRLDFVMDAELIKFLEMYADEHNTTKTQVIKDMLVKVKRKYKYLTKDKDAAQPEDASPNEDTDDGQTPQDNNL